MNTQWLRSLLSSNAKWSRRRVFAYEIIVLGALWTLAALHLRGALVLPDQFGTIPIGVPFFGAVGAVLISLSAVFDFKVAKSWDPSWEAWHYTRWLIGGTVGIVSVLIFQAGILSTGLDLEEGDASNLTYYLIAFAVGYREATFRELMRRVIEVVVAPGPGTPPTVSLVSPEAGSTGGGNRVSITGTNLARVTSVRFGPNDAEIIEGQRSAHSVHVKTPAGDPGVVAVTVQNNDGSDATKSFEYV